jgi:O-antigen/teichoic acid export membrane protein
MTFVELRVGHTWGSSKLVAVVLGWMGVAFSSIGQLAIPAIIVRSLGADALPLWQYIVSLFFLSLLAELGVSQGVVRVLIANYGDSNKYAVAYNSAKKPLWLIGLAVFSANIALVFYAITTGSVIPEKQSVFVVAMAIFAIWGCIKSRYALPMHAIMAEGAVAKHAGVGALISCVRPLAGVAVLWLGGSLIQMVAVYVLSEALAMTLGLWCAHRPTAKIAGPNGPMLRKEILSFGLSNGVQGLATQSGNYLQPLVIATLIGFKEVSVFVSSLTLVILAQRFIYPAFSPWYPRLIKWGASGNTAFFPEDFRRYLPRVLWALLIPSIIIYLSNGAFVGLWVGAEFYAGNLFTFLAILHLPLYALDVVATITMRAYVKKYSLIYLVGFCELVVTVCITSVSMYFWGLCGLISALAFVRICKIPTVYLLLRRKING